MNLTQLVESQATDIKILEADDDTTIARARFLVSEADKRNRNDRVYPLSVWEKQISRFRKGTVTGQDTHPSFFDGAPKVTDAFLVFDKLERIGHEIFGEALVADTQQGRDFVSVADAGAKIAVSTRGIGSVELEKKWTDGKEASVVQDDYRLLGVDVLLDGYQSVSRAKMKDLSAEAVYFVHEDIKEFEMDITVEWLQENHADVVEELTDPFTVEAEGLTEQAEATQQELAAAQDQVEQLTTDLEAAETFNAELASAQVELEQAGTSLQEQLDEATGERDQLSEQVNELTDERDTAVQLAETRQLIFEKAQGERAAMLIVQDLLRECATPADVARHFPIARRSAQAMLLTLPGGTPKSTHIPDDQDGGSSTSPEDNPDNFAHLRVGGLAI